MRLAVFLAILARELDEHIFQPSYLSIEDNSIREVLVGLAMTEPKREAFCRALLLSLDPETQAMNLEDRKKTVVKNVGSCLLELLSPTQFQGVRTSLEEIVQRAAEVWKSFQHNTKKYDTEFEPGELEEEEWHSFIFIDATENQSANGDIHESSLTIFPRLLRVDNNELIPCSALTVLTRPQCAAAFEESRRREPSSPRVARVNSDRRRPRRMSISTINANSQNRSFLDDTSRSDMQSNK